MHSPGCYISFKPYRYICLELSLLFSIPFSFLWDNRHPRIRLTTLTLPKQNGGIALPHMQQYYWACHLTRIIDWNVHAPYKDWVSVDQLKSDTPVGSWPWIPHKLLLKTIVTHLLIGATLSTFAVVCRRTSISSLTGPLTLVRHNPSFAPGNHASYLTTCFPSTTPMARHFFDNTGVFKSLPALNSLDPLHPIPFWTYLQLHHFLTATRHKAAFSRPLMVFEQLCTSDTRVSKAISTVYSSLITPNTVTLTLSEANWKKDIGSHFYPEEWESMNTLLLGSSRNVQIQETNYKLRSRWYSTPVLLNCLYPETPNVCWRCLAADGSLLHIWWGCKHIESYWTRISDLIAKVTDVHLEFSPDSFLFPLL